MVDNNKISIIIPIYNSEAWLKECIESVIKQTYKNIEIILIDDGSKDKSGEICDKYQKKDKRIKVIHKVNEGVSIARNIGIENASGKYIKFVDSDDWLEANCCEKLINAMEDENVDLVICGLNIYKNGKLLRTPHLDNKKIEIKKDIKNFEYIKKVFASPCNKLYKTEKIINKFSDRKDLGEDLIFNLQYLKNIDVLYTSDLCLYNVRLDNNESLNRKFRENKIEMVLDTDDKQLEFCNEVYGEDIKKDFIYNQYLLSLHAYLLDITKVYDGRKCKKIINKYVNDERIRDKIKYIKIDRIDYKIFKCLVKGKLIEIIYFYIKLKNLLLKGKVK